MVLGIGLRTLLSLSVTAKFLKNQRMAIPCAPTSHSPRKSSTENRTHRPALCHPSPHPVCYPEMGRNGSQTDFDDRAAQFVCCCSSLWRWRSRTFEGHHAPHAATLPQCYSLATRLPGTPSLSPFRRCSSEPFRFHFRSRMSQQNLSHHSLRVTNQGEHTLNADSSSAYQLHLYGTSIDSFAGFSGVIGWCELKARGFGLLFQSEVILLRAFRVR